MLASAKDFAVVPAAVGWDWELLSELLFAGNSHFKIHIFVHFAKLEWKSMLEQILCV